MRLLITPVLLLAACVGSYEVEGGTAGGARADAGSPGPGAAEMFAAAVQPTLARCAGAACHTGTGSPLKFLGSEDPGDDYDSIIGFPSVTGGYEPSLAMLLVKIEPGPHNGMRYSESERAAIVDWLAAEKAARADGGGDGDDTGGDPPVVADALAAWSGCMTVASWNQAEMGSWADKPTDDGEVCASCHADGAYRFNTADDSDLMFEMNRYPLYIIGFFTVGVTTDGEEVVLPAAEKLVRMGDGSTLHPRFGTGPGDPYFAAMARFYSLTRDIQIAGQCGPPVTPP